MKSNRTTLISTFAAVLAAFSCGTNVLKSSEPKDAAEDATVELEKGNPSGAIDTLNGALANDPTNQTLLSILALAYAERAGFEPLQFATNMAAAQSSGSSVPAGGAVAAVATGENLTSLFSVVPDATTSNIKDIDQAVTILNTQIPAASRQLYDTFKLALFQTGSLILHLKSLDTNGDGVLEKTELDFLNDTSAGGLLSQLASAEAIIASADPNDPAVQAAAKNLAKYQAQIDAEPGTTNANKLKNYLESNPGAAAAAATGTGTGFNTSTLTGTGTGTGL